MRVPFGMTSVCSLGKRAFFQMRRRGGQVAQGEETLEVPVVKYSQAHHRKQALITRLMTLGGKKQSLFLLIFLIENLEFPSIRNRVFSY